MFDLAHYLESRVAHVRDTRVISYEPRVALLLAGGDGTRLQELTRKITGLPIPKQYCRLLHGRSLLEATLSRSQWFVPLDRTFAVINQSHVELATEQLQPLAAEHVLVQPCNRDTGPGIVFALQHIVRRYPNATVAAFPTDHYVDDDWTFVTHVLRAARIVERYPDKIAVLGVVPDRPETGYGYILPAQPKGTEALPWPIFEVVSFREKPASAEARFLISRGALWNTFLMVFRVSRMLELLRSLALEECRPLWDLNDDPSRAPEVYRTVQPWSFSQRVLTSIPEHLLVLEISDVEWSDWGTPESVERTYGRLKTVPPWRQGVQQPAVSS